MDSCEEPPVEEKRTVYVMYGGQWKKEPTFPSVGWTLADYDIGGGGSFIVIEDVTAKGLAVERMYRECRIRDKKLNDRGYIFTYLKKGELFEVKLDEDLVSWWHESDRDDRGRMYLYVYSLKLNPASSEPSSSNASVMSKDHVPAHTSSFANFFSDSMNIGNPSNAANPGQSQPPTSRISLTSHAPYVVPSPVPTQKIAFYIPHSPSPPLPLYPPAKLLTPSLFVHSPSQSTLMVPQVSSTIPNVPPVHSPVNLQHPYGPLLQPFPPPPPSPSLMPVPSATPIPNFGPFITRARVQKALVRMFQKEEFLEMFYQELLNT